MASLPEKVNVPSSASKPARPAAAPAQVQTQGQSQQAPVAVDLTIRPSEEAKSTPSLAPSPYGAPPVSQVVEEITRDAPLSQPLEVTHPSPRKQPPVVIELQNEPIVTSSSSNNSLSGPPSMLYSRSSGIVDLLNSSSDEEEEGLELLVRSHKRSADVLTDITADSDNSSNKRASISL